MYVCIGEVDALNNLGNCYLSLRQYDTARLKLEHARGILLHLNDPSVKAAEASCCVSLALGNCYRYPITIKHYAKIAPTN
jgi:hypothetical protein